MPTREEAKQAAVAAPEVAPESKVEAPAGESTPKIPRAPKPKAEPTDCGCKVPDHDKLANVAVGDAIKFPGCRGGKTTRKFAPGHDARLVGYTTRLYAAGKISADDAIASVREKSGNSALLVGKIKTAVKRVDDEKASTARREQAAKDAKSTADSTESTPEATVDAQAAAAAE